MISLAARRRRSSSRASANARYADTTAITIMAVMTKWRGVMVFLFPTRCS